MDAPRKDSHTDCAERSEHDQCTPTPDAICEDRRQDRRQRSASEAC
jgi:hypothetical protein